MDMGDWEDKIVFVAGTIRAKRIKRALTRALGEMEEAA
jgi:hypothetical protein